MSNVLSKLKNLFTLVQFGLKGANNEIMGAGSKLDNAGTEINQEVSDERVAKHLLKGEITQEVEELRYRTYAVDREADKYNYLGSGLAAKKDAKNANDNVIKFTQENKLICNDVLTELSHVNNYGVEKYVVNIEYSLPVRIKMQEFLTNVDVLIKKGESAVTTLRFSDIMNPSSIRSKPFINELEKLYQLFVNNDTYGISRHDYSSSLSVLSFVTFNPTDEQPSMISYSFINPEIIDIKHENGEYKISYKWGTYNVVDLTEKFFNEELFKKYKNKEKKNIKIDPVVIEEWKSKTIKCSECGREINIYDEGYITNELTDGKPICLNCYKKHLQNN